MNICVYGASSDEIDKRYIEDGEKLGKLLAENGIGLVFGAGGHGMMGAAARGATLGNGKIIGVVPRFFNVDGILYDKCDELIRTDTMRERKQIMEDKSDGFVMTAGGIGTFEEFFEILTLKQLGRHTKPIAILNTSGYYDDMMAMMNHAIEKKFVFGTIKELYAVCSTPEEVIEYIKGYRPEDISVSRFKSV